MNLLLRDKAGERRWEFSLTDTELYEVLCTQSAWKLASSSGKGIKWTRSQIPRLIATMRERTPQEIASIEDPFIKLICSELQRLQIRLGED